MVPGDKERREKVWARLTRALLAGFALYAKRQPSPTLPFGLSEVEALR